MILLNLEILDYYLDFLDLDKAQTHTGITGTYNWNHYIFYCGPEMMSKAEQKALLVKVVLSYAPAQVGE